MNTYQITWYPASAASPSTATIQAKEFIVNERFVTFIDDGGQVAFALSVDLLPVVDRTAVG